MAAAKKGSANASIRRTDVPRACISATGDNKLIISGAKIYMITPMNAITSIPKNMVIHAKLRCRSRLPAPTLCPTRVVAASLIP